MNQLLHHVHEALRLQKYPAQALVVAQDLASVRQVHHRAPQQLRIVAHFVSQLAALLSQLVQVEAHDRRKRR